MDFFSKYHDYHLKVIDTLKTALYQKDNAVFEKLDFYDDDIFTEPLLFSCINYNYEDWIETLIFSLSKEGKTSNSIYTTKAINRKIIYLPTLGYLKLDKEYSERIQLKYVKDSIELFDEENNNLSYKLEPLIKNINGIEFLTCIHPLIEPLFVNEKGKITETLISEVFYTKYIGHFNSALEIIKKVYPEYFNLVKNYIKKVVFYKGEANSFATIQAHGAVFFNISHGNSEVFFLDNILHQCAHVFFNTLTLDKSEIFKIPHNSDLSVFTGKASDKGFALYDRFHGLFTQTNINICFDRCLEDNLYRGDGYLEFLAKFTSNMKRFSAAIKKFNRPDNYLEKGLDWFCYFKNIFETINEKNKIVLNKYDVSNQPYIFDYELFKKTNDLS